jgi:putative redox protein
MTEPKPPVTAQLIWSEERCFNATSAKVSVLVDGDSIAGPSPVQLLAIGLAGCMSIDVVDIIRRGHHPLTAFRSAITGHRTPDPPRRFTSLHLQFTLHGDVPHPAVERAIALSHDRYCSVWHSLRQDIDLTTAFDIHP